MKLAGQRDNSEQVSEDFIYNQLFIKNISQFGEEKCHRSQCYNLFFMEKFLSRCPANFSLVFNKKKHRFWPNGWKMEMKNGYEFIGFKPKMEEKEKIWTETAARVDEF